jgi:microcin C transport system ATP-binding protein
MLLKIDKLCCDLVKDDTTSEQILDNVSLSVDHGETVAIVGESGSGKTVTALSILRLIEEIATVRQTGAIFFEDRDIFPLSTDQMRMLRGNDMAMIFQEPMTSLNPVYTVGNQLLEPLQLHRQMNRREALAEAASLLHRTGIPDPEERLGAYPHQLSGGQRQRVMIAMAIACRPKLLIADEPTTALDVTVQAQILDLLKGLQEEFNMAILLITHNLPIVSKIADHVHIMKNGRIIEHGATKNIFHAPQHAYTKKLLHSIPSTHPAAKASAKPLVVARNLSCRFTLKGKKKHIFSRDSRILTAVDDVNLSIAQGSTLGIVGESGSGKTTLGMALLRLVGSTGEIVFDAQSLQGLKGRDLRPLRKEMQVIFQDPFSSLSPRLTVEDIVAEGLRVHEPQISKQQRRRQVMETLTEVGLAPEMARRYPHEFSGGQRQRIAIARSVILHPRFLVLDEPTSALDMTIQAQIIDLLTELQRKYNMTYMFISHDLLVVRALADQVMVMQNGKVVEAGPADEIFTSPQHHYTQTLFQAALGE